MRNLFHTGQVKYYPAYNNLRIAHLTEWNFRQRQLAFHIIPPYLSPPLVAVISPPPHQEGSDVKYSDIT
jgi:hypothetical protein